MKRICVIINPAAGTDFPILSVLHRRLHDQQLDYDIFVTKSEDDIARFTLLAIEKKYSAVAVYGGDGSILEAAKILYTSTIPLVILPGGTSNILAKELGIPVTIEDALQVLLQKTENKKTIDVGLCNTVPFFLRVSIGLMADMVIQAESSTKKSFGQLAYPITLMKSLNTIEEATYTITIDGKTLEDTGYSLVVANSGNIGISGVSVSSDISVTDEKLDILLVKNALDFTTKTLTHWQGKMIKVVQSGPQHKTICDDVQMSTPTLEFSIAPEKLHVLIP